MNARKILDEIAELSDVLGNKSCALEFEIGNSWQACYSDDEGKLLELLRRIAEVDPEGKIFCDARVVEITNIANTTSEAQGRQIEANQRKIIRTLDEQKKILAAEKYKRTLMEESQDATEIEIF